MEHVRPRSNLKLAAWWTRNSRRNRSSESDNTVRADKEGGLEPFVPLFKPIPDHWGTAPPGDLRMLLLKYPDAPPLPMKMPSPDEIRLFRVTPTVISVLDYSKGFGHTDLVACWSRHPRGPRVIRDSGASVRRRAVRNSDRRTYSNVR